MQSVATHGEAYSSYQYSRESKASYQSTARAGQSVQSAQRNSEHFAKTRNLGYLEEAYNRQSANSDNMERASQRLAANGASYAAEGASAEQSASGDVFATYGTKKERRTVQKEAQSERASEKSSERSESREQSQTQKQAEVAERRQLEEKAAWAAREQAAAVSREAEVAGRRQLEEKAAWAAREQAAAVSREAEVAGRRQLEEKAARAAREQAAAADNKRAQPPPLPPKQSELWRRRENNRHFDAKFKMQAAKTGSEASNSTSIAPADPNGDKPDASRHKVSDPGISPPQMTEYRTQATATEAATFSRPAVSRTNANVGTDTQAKTEHRNQSTDMDNIDLVPLSTNAKVGTDPQAETEHRNQSIGTDDIGLVPTNSAVVVASSNTPIEPKKSITPDSPDVDEDVLTPTTHPNVQAPSPLISVDKAVSTDPASGRDFSQQVISDGDSVLEEMISPDNKPTVMMPNKSPPKPKIPSNMVDAPVLVDDPRVTQPVSKELRRPVNEVVDRSVCPVVEVEPDFRWMLPSKAEQTDISSDAMFPENDRLSARVATSADVFTEMQSDLEEQEISPHYQSSQHEAGSADVSRLHSKARLSVQDNERKQYETEITHLKSMISELESRLIVSETRQVQGESPDSNLVNIRRRTVGLTAKPSCRDVAINVVFEDAKPAQRSVGVNVSAGDQELASRSAESCESKITDKQATTNTALIVNQSQTRQTFIQSLHQTYGISKIELVTIITELLKRDVKSVGLQVCTEELDLCQFDSDVRVISPVEYLNSSSFMHKSTSSSRLAGSIAESARAVSPVGYMDSSSFSLGATSSSRLVGSIGESARASEVGSNLMLRGSTVAIATESSVPQYQEENAHHEYQFASEDGSVTAHQSVTTTRRVSSQQALVEPRLTDTSAIHSSYQLERQQRSARNEMDQPSGGGSYSRVQSVSASLLHNSDAADQAAHPDSSSESMNTEFSFEMMDDDPVDE